jgi:hypothetical protein
MEPATEYSINHVCPHGSKNQTEDKLHETAVIRGDVISMADSELKMSDRIITGDEKCCYLYDPQTRQQSSYWKFLTSPKQHSLYADRSKGKVMLKVFFDSKSIVYHEFIPQGHTVNKTMYRDILRCLRDAIRWKHLELW